MYLTIQQQAQSQCITHADFIKLGRVYTLRSLSPGNYSIQIKATSLAKDIDHFTEIRYFFIRVRWLFILFIT